MDDQPTPSLPEASIDPAPSPASAPRPAAPGPQSPGPQPDDSPLDGWRAALESAEAQAAADLAAAYRHLPGVAADLIQGTTVADVQAALAAARRVYADVRAAVLAELSAGVPPAHGTPATPPPPATPFALIRAGVAQD